MNMNGQSWDNKTQAVDFTKCGTKEYDVTDRNEIQNCARECVVRAFLEQKKMAQYVSKLEKIEPADFYNYLQKIPVKDIQDKFFYICQEVEQYLWDNKKYETVTLYIEKGDAERIVQAIHNNAFNEDESKIESMIYDIFTVVNALHKVGVVHADIKPENFLYCRRGNEDILVLNDFDTSFVLPPEEKCISLNKPAEQILGITPRYAAPEQFGVPEYKIGHATDVFSASLIAYTMLNGGKHPKEYDFLNGTPKEDQYSQMKKMFQEMNKNEQDFDPCERGTKLKEIISEGIQISPGDRPSAIRFLSIDNHQNTVPEIPTEIADTSSPKNKETEAPTEKKEEKPMDEQKNEQGNKNIDNREGIIGDHNIVINPPPQLQPPDKHISLATVFIVILALVIVGVVALVVISKSGGDTNISNNVSVTASIATSTFEIETSEIPTEYITTVSSTTETTSEIIQSTETEKKKTILLQL